MKPFVTELSKLINDPNTRINPAIDPKLVAEVLKSIPGILTQANDKLQKLDKINHNIVHVEFFSGIFGTIIWGFGDILINLIK